MYYRSGDSFDCSRLFNWVVISCHHLSTVVNCCQQMFTVCRVWTLLAGFPAVFFHISLGICHGTQQAVVTAYRVYQNVWTSISGRNERFEPFFLQNIHVWYMKGELESAWYAKELKICSWEAIFTTLGALAPHIEDEPRNEEQHCKNQMLLPIDHPNQIRSSFFHWNC